MLFSIFKCFFDKIVANILNILMKMSSVYDEEGWSELCKDAEIINLRSLEGTSCYCEEAARKYIKNVISSFDPSGIHWLDSGDYHYLSLFWLEKIGEPFSLVLFDHHPDMQAPAFPMLSCGGWMRDALRNPLLGTALVLGISPSLLEETEAYENVHAICDGDPRLLDPAAVVGLLPEDAPVYFSIDKDVLSEQYARTDWDQGSMTMDTLSSLIAAIKGSRRVLGADICGEIGQSKGATGKDYEINISANRYLRSLLEMS